MACAVLRAASWLDDTRSQFEPHLHSILSLSFLSLVLQSIVIIMSKAFGLSSPSQSPASDLKTTFVNVFAASAIFFPSLAFLAFLVRILLRLALFKFSRPLTPQEKEVANVISVIAGICHSGLIVLLLALKDSGDSNLLPDEAWLYWAVCYSTAIWVAVCGGLGMGLLCWVLVVKA